jgi:hypothetical protein
MSCRYPRPSWIVNFAESQGLETKHGETKHDETGKPLAGTRPAYVWAGLRRTRRQSGHGVVE